KGFGDINRLPVGSEPTERQPDSRLPYRSSSPMIERSLHPSPPMHAAAADHVRLSRRSMLQIGCANLIGLSLPQLLRADAERPRSDETRADACIIVFLDGGPSHLDMWDMKPDAPAEIRGEFKAIPSSVPGLFVSEHLPRMAKVMHLATLIRSAHHSVNN